MGRIVRGFVQWVLIGVLVFGAAYWYFTNRQGAAPEAQGGGGPPGGFAVPVEAMPVIADTAVRSASAIGTLISNESVVIRPEIAGVISAIQFEEGQPVAAGSALISLDDSIYQAELERAQARLELSQANYNRAATLEDRGIGSEQARDEASANLRADSAEVTLAKARLAKTTIMAPFDGVLGMRLVSIGDFVNAGQDIVNLESLNPLKLDFRVSEVFLQDLAVGQQINVDVDAFPGRDFIGWVAAIDPLVDATGRSIAVRALVPNDDGVLRPGLFARVDLVLETRPNALFVPEAAVFPFGQQSFVYKVVEDKAALTPVTVGLRRDGLVEVTGALVAGDLVVTAGHMKIGDGAPVAVLPPAS